MDNFMFNFTSYCKVSGINLLRDDVRFIENIVKGWPINYKRRVLRQYIQVWNEAKAEKGDNQGRRAANTFLREFVEGL